MRYSDPLVVETPRRVLRPHGRTYVVTGAGGGLGDAIARGLLRAGARVMAVARDRVRAEEVRGALTSEAPRSRVDVVAADLSVRAEIERGAAEVLERHPEVHGLFHCAGLRTARRETSSDGHERMFAVEYLAPFLLTNRLLEALRASAPTRVVAVVPHGIGSGPWAARSLNTDNLQGDGSFHPLAHAKHLALARLLFMREFGRRTYADGVTPIVVAPGATRTGLNRRLPLHLRLVARALEGMRAPQLPQKAGHHLMEAVTDPDFEGAQYRYVEEGRETVDVPAARDPNTARRLWEWTEELLGERFAAGDSGEAPAAG